MDKVHFDKLVSSIREMKKIQKKKLKPGRITKINRIILSHYV